MNNRTDDTRSYAYDVLEHVEDADDDRRLIAAVEAGAPWLGMSHPRWPRAMLLYSHYKTAARTRQWADTFEMSFEDEHELPMSRPPKRKITKPAEHRKACTIEVTK